jgi:Protein of unknown function (DUF3168)
MIVETGAVLQVEALAGVSSGLVIDVESATPLQFLSSIRAAFFAKMATDAVLAGLLGSDDRIVYRPQRAPEVYPAVSFLDFGAWPDPTVPLTDRTFQVDVWATYADEAERIADRIARLIDFRAARQYGMQPIAMNPAIGRITGCFLTDDRDDVADEGDTARKTLGFRLLAYRH